VGRVSGKESSRGKNKRVAGAQPPSHQPRPGGSRCSASSVEIPPMSGHFRAAGPRASSRHVSHRVLDNSITRPPSPAPPTMVHPYYPPSLALPLYTAPVFSQPTLILGMGGISIGVLVLAWQIMTKLNPSLSRRAKATANWFLYCGLLHVHFEGYFIKYRRTLAGRNDFVANLWKEYSLSDSRYLAQDGFVVGIEALTVVSDNLLPIEPRGTGKGWRRTC
jgi:hypothetical protein